jgi:hypothetical protein
MVATTTEPLRCSWDGRRFNDPRNSVRRKTVIWVRLTLRLSGEHVKLHGPICATCRDKVESKRVTVMS